MELRPYQQEAKDAIFEQWDSGVLKTLLVLPTGCGKTVVFAKVTEDCVRQGSRVLILAHRGELLDQAADKLKKTTGLGCAVEKAESSCQGTWFRVVVGSVQTLMREKRLNSFPSDYFDTIIIDEAHHCISDSYQRVLQHFSGAHVLGVTATPDRGDMKNLGTYFESLAYEYTLPKAIKEGYLSPIKALTIPLKIDMSGVSMQAGDFKASDISTALDPYLQGIAEEMKKYCQDKKTVVFLPLVKTSQKFRDLLNENGFRAAEVNGDSQDRAEILKDFDAGKYNVLCNSMLLTEGWDCPSVDCIVVLRPTKVRRIAQNDHVKKFFDGTAGVEQVQNVTPGKIYEIYKVEGYGDVADFYFKDDVGKEQCLADFFFGDCHVACRNGSLHPSRHDVTCTSHVHLPVLFSSVPYHLLQWKMFYNLQTAACPPIL